MVIQRPIYLQRIENGFKHNPIVVLLGPRQVGKTTLMQMYKFRGVTTFLHGQHPDTLELFKHVSLIERHLEIELGPEMKGLLMLDEFQVISQVSTTLKILVDLHQDLKILCTGSSSLDIVQQVGESLAGRVRLVEVFPLLFSEYLEFAEPPLYDKFKKYQIHDPFRLFDRAFIQVYHDYILFGGMPKVALARSREEKTELLNDIYITYLLRDVRAYVRNEDSVGFNKLLRLLASQVGMEVSVSELSVTSGLSYKKCEDYLYLLEQMFILRRLEPYLTNKRKEIVKMKKIFFYDTGIRNIIYGSFLEFNLRSDKGPIFENIVLNQILPLLPALSKVQFYRTKDGLEVDFIVTALERVIPVEIKAKSLSKPLKIRALDSFRQIIPYEEALLVNLDYHDVESGVRYLSGMVVEKYFGKDDEI